MERELAADGAVVDNGYDPRSWEILGEKTCLLEYVDLLPDLWLILTMPGWAKYMTWAYPVEVVVTNPAEFAAAGIVAAAAPL